MSTVAQFKDKGAYPPSAFVVINNQYEALIRTFPIDDNKTTTILELYYLGGVAKGHGTEQVYDLATIGSQADFTESQAARYKAEAAAITSNAFEDQLKKQIRTDMAATLESIAMTEASIKRKLIEEGILGKDGNPITFEPRPLPPNFKDPKAGTPYRITFG